MCLRGLWILDLFVVCVCVCLCMSAHVDQPGLQQKRESGVTVSKGIIYTDVARESGKLKGDKDSNPKLKIAGNPLPLLGLKEQMEGVYNLLFLWIKHS